MVNTGKRGLMSSAPNKTVDTCWYCGEYCPDGMYCHKCGHVNPPDWHGKGYPVPISSFGSQPNRLEDLMNKEVKVCFKESELVRLRILLETNGFEGGYVEVRESILERVKNAISELRTPNVLKAKVERLEATLEASHREEKRLRSILGEQFENNKTREKMFRGLLEPFVNPKRWIRTDGSGGWWYCSFERSGDENMPSAAQIARRVLEASPNTEKRFDEGKFAKGTQENPLSYPDDIARLGGFKPGLWKYSS